MKDLFTVMKFTMKDMVKRKSFIISTLIILIFIVVGFNVPNLIKSFNGDNFGDKLLNKLVADGINIDKFEIKKPTLNDIFIEKVGEC